MLREYLLYDLIPDDHGWMQDYDKERLIDDFVCLMILLGDDFLPELPSLDINEGSVQFIIGVYKSASQRSLTRRDVISSMHAFLIEDAKPVLPVLKALFTQIGSTEREVRNGGSQGQVLQIRLRATRVLSSRSPSHHNSYNRTPTPSEPCPAACR